MRAATLATQVAVVAVFVTRPPVPVAAAMGVAALILLLAADGQRPFLKGRKGMLAAAATSTAAATAAAELATTALSVVAPLAILAVYLVATFFATPAKPGNRSGSSVK